MLKVEDLKSQIKTALSNIIPTAIETCKKNEAPIRSKVGDEAAEQFAKQFDEMVSEPLANSIAYAIDYYIKNADITGTVITTGSPVTQTAKIVAPPAPVSGGQIPNTFGIN